MYVLILVDRSMVVKSTNLFFDKKALYNHAYKQKGSIMAQKTLILLFIASTVLKAADPAQDMRVTRLFNQLIGERCVLDYIDTNSQSSLCCVNNWSNYYQKIICNAYRIAFSEGLLQQYLAHKEATALMLVSTLHHQEIIKYRQKRIELHREETKEDCTALRKVAFNDLGIHPKTVVFDASGNRACGITNDVTKIVVFSVYPYYAKVSETYIDRAMSQQKITLPMYTSNYILGALLFGAQKTFGNVFAGFRTSLAPHIITYLPTGHHELYYEVEKANGVVSYHSFSNCSKITFFKEVHAQHVSFKNCTTILSSETKQYQPFFTISLPGYEKTFQEDQAKIALELLHDFSPS